MARKQLAPPSQRAYMERHLADGDEAADRDATVDCPNPVRGSGRPRGPLIEELPNDGFRSGKTPAHPGGTSLAAV
jgi:hypothetical protein